ncbi:MAG: dihydroxyacetone kinase subunit L [Erysipelothrix sp.]|jgi:dihydroxyacetone kinase-like protein|nr:dihydroxyacetone kinase subunit L [Erysipelothrix sp.]
MNQEKIVIWFKKWASVINDEMDYISDLDNAIGDGDHGFNMSKGLTAYLEARDSKSVDSITDELKLMGMTLLSKVGGASGPLYGSAFLAMAKLTGDKTELSKEDLVEMLQAGIDSIKRLGKAVRYEKTMVDLWEPAIDLLRNGSLTPSTVDELVEATAPLKATKGRASYLGERSIGHIDPGSYSSGILFKKLVEMLN